MNLNDYAKECHENAVAKGFWGTDRNFGEMIALMHSELSEALEAHRAGEPEFYLDANGKPEGTSVELIDCLIRILDTLQRRLPEGVTVEDVLRLKMQYNAGRKMMHGKAY